MILEMRSYAAQAFLAPLRARSRACQRAKALWLNVKDPPEAGLSGRDLGRGMVRETAQT